MKPFLVALLPFLIFPVLSAAQDPQVRQQAVLLLERANQVSLSPNLPNLERTDFFQVLDSTSSDREGSFTRVVIQGTGRRDEVKFGSYHSLDVWTRNGLATSRTSEILPPEVVTLLQITPIRDLRFDQSDVIHSIEDRASAAGPLKCIEFDTIEGETRYNNEICVHAADGTLATLKLDNEFIEYSDYFPFAGALMPATIEYSYAGVPKLEIHQTMTEWKDSSADVLAAPPDARMRQFCTTYRRPILQFSVQPAPGNSSAYTEVLVRGMIGTDGRVHQALIQSSDRPDLNAEALQVVSQWIFSPAVCNGRPNFTVATFLVRFQGH
jgi:hypothetical protein